MSDSIPYVPSGKCGLHLPLATLATLPLIVVAAALYAYLDVYLPLAGTISVFLTLGFALLLGAATSVALRIGHCRSRVLGAACGFAVGVLGWYASWAIFEHALLTRAHVVHDGLLSLAAHPAAVARLAALLSQDGWFSLFGWTPSGPILLALWSLEALAILAVPTWIGAGFAAEHVFCERCRAWLSSRGSGLRFLPDSTPAIAQALVSGDVASLADVERATSGAPAYLRVEHHACPRCEREHAVRGSLVRASHDARGRRSERQTQAFPPWRVDGPLAQALHDAYDPPSASLDVARAA